MKTTIALAALLLTLAFGPAQAQDTVRPEVGKPLQAAQELIRAGKYREALARLREADAVPNRSAHETYLLERMRGSAAAGAGDDATAGKAFEAAIASGRMQPAEKLQIYEALAGSAYRAKDYARALQWTDRYLKEGGSSPQMNQLRVSAHYLAGDYAGVVRELQREVQSVEKAAPQIDETTLRMLAASQAKLKDDAGYEVTLEKLLRSHPKPEYWADALSRLPRKPGFPDRLMLDVYRLMLVTQTLTETEQYSEMAQLALQAGLPAEAKQVVEAGYAAGKLGTGAEADRHKRLRDLATRQAAEDQALLKDDANGPPEALVNTGLALVSVGRVDRGIELMELGLSKPGLKRPEEARLRLGQAYLKAGNRAKAAEVFRTVTGPGAADLARLWALQASARR